MFGNVMRDTAARRAMAAIINTLDIEIIARRDVCSTSIDRAELRMFILTYNSFKQAWDSLNPDCDSISYAVAWDTHLSSRRFNKQKIENLVHHHVRTILSEVSEDIRALLPVSTIENIRAGEKALADIVDIDRTVVLAG